MHRHPGRGFTIIEAMIVVTIMGVLAAIGFQALQGVSQRSKVTTTINNVVARLTAVRTEAFGQGVPIVFVVNKNTHKYWVVIDRDGDFSLGGFDISDPTDGGSDRIVEAEELPRDVKFGPNDGYGRSRLPAPYSWVPVDSACTFCPGPFGAITFHADGTASLTGSNANAGSFTIGGQTEQSKRALTIAIIARTASIQTYERFW